MEFEGMTIRTINPEEPPDLRYSTIDSIVLNGERLPRRLNYWGRLFFAVIGKAAMTLPKSQVTALVTCGFVPGRRKTAGYHYIGEADLSIQTQNANSTWQATYHILETIRMPVEIEFSWQIGGKPSGDAAPAKIVVSWNA
jgi:hypothetical protein